MKKKKDNVVKGPVQTPHYAENLSIMSNDILNAGNLFPNPSFCFVRIAKNRMLEI